MLNIKKIKPDFPIFKTYPNLVYLDSAATSHKPQVVINAISEYYTKYNANIHRGVHKLSDLSTKIWQESRDQIASFFGADANELIITRNATEAINLAAYAWGENNLKQNNIILTSIAEHHANLVPWQELCKKNNCQLKFIKLNKNYNLDLADLENKLIKYQNKIKLIAINHVSNTLGSITPIEQIIKLIKKLKLTPKILIDGAQSAPHLKINFSKLNIDFYAFSGHKMLGPMGAGGLLVKKEILENEMRPFLFGGGMISAVKLQSAEFNHNLQERFTAGTPDVASIYGLSKACLYLENLKLDQVEQHDKNLVNYALEKLNKIKNIKLIGPVKNRLGSIAFVHKNIHAHDIAQVLDSEHIAVRSGHHCCMPLHNHLKIAASVRASFNIYNDFADIDKLVAGLEKAEKILV